MSARRETLPYWPAAMKQIQAAAYCGLSVDTFKELCPIKPIAFTDSTHGKRYLRYKLDEWLESLDPNSAKSPARRFGDRLNGHKGAA